MPDEPAWLLFGALTDVLRCLGQSSMTKPTEKLTCLRYKRASHHCSKCLFCTYDKVRFPPPQFPLVVCLSCLIFVCPQHL